jgi:hypothetical protein
MLVLRLIQQPYDLPKMFSSVVCMFFPLFFPLSLLFLFHLCQLDTDAMPMTFFSTWKSQWLCKGDYGGGHFSSGRCSGKQFAPFDSIEEAEAQAEQESREQREREEQHQRYLQTPEGQREERRRLRRQRRRKFKKGLKTAAVCTVAAPLVVVGGVALVGAVVVASPFILLASLTR